MIHHNTKKKVSRYVRLQDNELNEWFKRKRKKTKFIFSLLDKQRTSMSSSSSAYKTAIKQLMARIQINSNDTNSIVCHQKLNQSYYFSHFVFEY